MGGLGRTQLQHWYYGRATGSTLDPFRMIAQPLEFRNQITAI
jgi:hypothetical protein